MMGLLAREKLKLEDNTRYQKYMKRLKEKTDMNANTTTNEYNRNS